MKHLRLDFTVIKRVANFENLPVMQDPANAKDVAFRIGVSNMYKPTIVEALAAFTDISTNASKFRGGKKVDRAEQGVEAAAGKLPGPDCL